VRRGSISVGTFPFVFIVIFQFLSNKSLRSQRLEAVIVTAALLHRHLTSAI